MSLFERKWFVLLLMLNSTSVTVSLTKYKLTPYVTHVEVTNNLKFVNFTAEILPTMNENRVNIDFYVIQPVYNPRIISTLWLDVGSGALKAPFYNQTVDFCSLIRNPGAHRLVQIVYRELKRHGNMPTGCPIARGLYKFRGISPGQMRLPPFLNRLDFMLDVIGLGGKERIHIFDSRWNGVINKVKCTAADRC
uniref:Uncharacterized protein n=1 Tax=Anopheles funestus TaxID=62324 RepID=A0A4Y0BV08_ANOFN